MDLHIDMGSLIAVAVAIIGAWWAIAVIAIKQFERRQDEKFTALQVSINEQKKELDGHLSRQDVLMSEIRRVENELARCQVDAATRYQTKDDAGKQFGQLIDEIRSLGNRIDGMHTRGMAQ